MSKSKRHIDVFTAGCAVCALRVEAILAAACEHCEVIVHDLSTGDAAAVRAAADFGVRRLPAVVIDGRLARCCEVAEPDLDRLRAEGLGAGA